MDPDHLLQIATDLTEINTRRPRRADLCRAVNTTYYALFHCLARSCADALAGHSRSVGNRPAWRQVYRALEHGQAKNRCAQAPGRFPEAIRQFGRRFVALQNKRHYADYDPDHRLRKTEVVADIEDVRTTIARFLATPAGDRRAFAIHVLMKARADA